MSRRAQSLGVDWFLPGRKRRFATTTVASSDLIVLLASEGRTWAEIVDGILFDDEAKAVAQRFVSEGYGDHGAAAMVGGAR